MESIGFKEWSAVCEAMGQGRQSIILRKGGIAEGREGFSFKYRSFFLFPTWFHEQPQKVRPDGLSPSDNAERPTSNAERRMESDVVLPQDDQVIEIRYAAELDVARTITSWDTAEALEAFHILQPEVVRERFNYEEAPGLHVAFVRVLKLQPAWIFPNEKRYGGCRSWVNLPPLPSNTSLQPVLGEARHEQGLKEFLAIVDKGEPIDLVAH